ncbi:hypothetical protein CYMTET_48740, partial [Cymbomonas tetramitiformis]
PAVAGAASRMRRGILGLPTVAVGAASRLRYRILGQSAVVAEAALRRRRGIQAVAGQHAFDVGRNSLLNSALPAAHSPPVSELLAMCPTDACIIGSVSLG